MNETMNKMNDMPEGFFRNMLSMDPAQEVTGGYSSDKPGYWLNLPAKGVLLTPHTAYLLHRALGQYMMQLAKTGATPHFMVETVGLPEDVTCFGLC